MNWSKTIIAIIVLVLIYLVFLFYSDIDKISITLSSINPIYLVLAIFMWIFVGILTSIRWHYFLKKIDDKIPLSKNIIYYLAGYAFVISPSGAGEVIRSPFIKRDFGISISKTVPIVFVERFYDLLGITIIIGMGLFFSNFEKSILILPLGLLITILFIIKKRMTFLIIIKKFSKIRFIEKIIPNAEDSFEVIFTLTRPNYFVIGTTISFINSILTTLSVYFLIVGMSADISLADLSVIYQTSNFIGAVSMVPGGIGVLEGGLVGLLVLYKIKYEIAVSVALLNRLLNTGLLSVIGLICLQIISKNKH